MHSIYSIEESGDRQPEENEKEEKKTRERESNADVRTE